MWKELADGTQSMTGQLGEGNDGTFASHWESPELSKLESSDWFGSPVANLAEAGAVIAKHDRFKECTLQQMLDLAIGLNPTYDTGIKGLKVDPVFLAEVATSVTSKNPDPPLQDLAVALLSDVRVIATTINGMKR